MQYTKGTYTMSKRELGALLAHASKDEARLHLAGVGFNHGHVVATDGHRLALCTVEGASDNEGKAHVVPRSALQEAYKAATVRTDIAIAANEDGYEIAVDGAGWSGKCPMTSPQYQQVIPAKERAGSVRCIGFNPFYMADVGKVLQATGGKAVAMSMGDELDPIRIDIPGEGCAWVVVVMPMRV